MKEKKSFFTFVWRVTSLHVLTYFIAGIAAFFIFNYEVAFSTGPLSQLMKPTDSPWVMLGTVLNIPRGILFAVVLWPFRLVFLDGKYDWTKLWGLFLGLAILGTCGPSPGSLEGMIYTKIPIAQQLIGLIEVVAQTLLFVFLLSVWYKNESELFNILTATLFTLITLMIIVGALATYG